MLQHPSYHLLLICSQYFLLKKHPQTIMLPPPNFTVGTLFFGLKASPSFFCAWFLELHPNNRIFVSYVLFPSTIFPLPYVYEQILTWHFCVFSKVVEFSVRSMTLDCPVNFIAYCLFINIDSSWKQLILWLMTINCLIWFNWRINFLKDLEKIFCKAPVLGF